MAHIEIEMAGSADLLAPQAQGSPPAESGPAANKRAGVDSSREARGPVDGDDHDEHGCWHLPGRHLPYGQPGGHQHGGQWGEKGQHLKPQRVRRGEGDSVGEQEPAAQANA